MSLGSILNHAIGDLRYTLNNDFVMQNLVAQLVNKIKLSNIILPQHKATINEYFKFGTQSQKYSLQVHVPKPSTQGSNVITKGSIKDLLVSTAIYYLSDLNNYDYHLINYGFNYGLGANDIIVLLLLNNIYDITTFCQKYGISRDKYYTISTLKKLSALHKLQYNF
jgi:hypothetical protein